MKLDRSKLPEGVSFERKEGLYAELGPEGQVIHLGIYENGQRKPGTYALDVAADGSWVRVEGPKDASGSQGTSAPEASDPGWLLEAWVALWSTWLSKGSQAPHAKDSKAPKTPGPAKDIEDWRANPACSFCGKWQDQVDKLVAGPLVYICNECIGLCNDMISFENERSGQ